MITEKLEQLVRRQTALIGKGYESLTDAERAELDKLNAAIAAATAEPEIAKSATRLTTMTEEEFSTYMTEAMEKEQSPDGLALLKRNIEAVRSQKADGKEIFAVELPVAKTAEDKLDEALTRIAELEDKLDKGFDGRTTSGLKNDQDKAGSTDEPNATGDTDVNGSQEEPTEKSVRETLIELREKTDNEDIKKSIDQLVAVLDEVAKDEEAKADEPESNPDEEADADEGEDADGAKGDSTEPTEKADDDFSWTGDLAKSYATSADEEFRMLKNSSGRGRE